MASNSEIGESASVKWLRRISQQLDLLIKITSHSVAPPTTTTTSTTTTSTSSTTTTTTTL